jgi:AraC-like DNA-binding protein
VTPKTLQRRLEEEGSQYQHLLDECRQALACEFLRQAQIELIEIAELTGYKDYSTFAKAFKQWTGQTPKVWRDQHG